MALNTLINTYEIENKTVLSMQVLLILFLIIIDSIINIILAI